MKEYEQKSEAAAIKVSRGTSKPGRFEEGGEEFEERQQQFVESGPALRNSKSRGRNPQCCSHLAVFRHEKFWHEQAM
jgi:hypothetical protein